jgi:hypothetical protein
MEFSNIEVIVPDRKLLVNFNYHEAPDKTQICTITSEGHTLTVDENLNVLNSDMPQDWVQPIMKVLQEIASGF